jgi:hypothetical protein
MRTAMTVAAMLVLAGSNVAAQDAVAPGRRAPLASVEDLEPAVDVGADVSAPRPRIQAEAATVVPAAAPPAAPGPSGQAASRTAPPAMDSLDLGTTSITGNAELPKVLYIVPWKKSDLGELVGRPVNTLLDEVLTPVDPAVFERHLSYYDSLYGEREEE